MGAAGGELQSVTPNIGRFATDDLGIFAPGDTIGSRASTSGLQRATRMGS